ncbi:hypothetical protein BFR75_01990 [Acinetobacter pittii]|uniref:hypothetical protein n=1 Tax=Acinetobacter pittii TaxID=48296 RepID=UPI0008386F0A|nr:hypothetical protein [Acinetobacter pittii]OCY34497.1 hypothetical protein BFR75_01990 [Acinetobacter pittii]
MNFLKKAELVNIVVNEIIYSAPANWSKIVYYTERLPDMEIGLRDASISRCWVGQDEKLYDASNGPALSISVELDDAVDELFIDSEKNKDIWTGFSVVVNKDGKYITQFYYKDTPLLDNKTDEYRAKLDALSELN